MKDSESPLPKPPKPTEVDLHENRIIVGSFRVFEEPSGTTIFAPQQQLSNSIPPNVSTDSFSSRE